LLARFGSFGIWRLCFDFFGEQKIRPDIRQNTHFPLIFNKNTPYYWVGRDTEISWGEEK
jgi:hypothetical protein